MPATRSQIIAATIANYFDNDDVTALIPQVSPGQWTEMAQELAWQTVTQVRANGRAHVYADLAYLFDEAGSDESTESARRYAVEYIATVHRSGLDIEPCGCSAQVSTWHVDACDRAGQRIRP